MSLPTSNTSPQELNTALHRVCEKSARSVYSSLRRGSKLDMSAQALSDFASSLSEVMERTTHLLLAGKQVQVVEEVDALTTQQAADLLNVSRPHLVKLLDQGVIPSLPKVGRHRRVARSSVMRYKRLRDDQRHKALAELTALSQHHQLGY